MNVKLIVFFAIIAAVYSAPTETEAETREKRTIVAPLVSSVVPTVGSVTPIVTSSVVNAPILSRSLYTGIDNTLINPYYGYSGYSGYYNGLYAPSYYGRSLLW